MKYSQAKSRLGAEIAKYSPKRDFRCDIGYCLPRMIREVVSYPVDLTDRWRMLLQAIAIARIGDRFKEDINKHFIMLAIYLHSTNVAERFLICKDPEDDSKV